MIGGARISAAAVSDPRPKCRDHHRQRRAGERLRRGLGACRVVAGGGEREGEQREVGRRAGLVAQHRGGAGGERDVAGRKRLAIRPQRDRRIGGPRGERAGVAGDRRRHVAVRIGDAGLHIVRDRIGAACRIGLRRRGDRDAQNRCEEQTLTYWDNWGLHRPPAPPS
nr:hypothetical protein [Sphingomonas melonis]